MLRLVIDKPRGESRFNKGDCMWRSRVNVDGERKTGADCNWHDLGEIQSTGFREFAGACSI
jgi:hypothetical protein